MQTVKRISSDKALSDLDPLSDNMIVTSGIEEISIQEAVFALGYELPRGIRSIYRIPYHGADGFFRCLGIYSGTANKKEFFEKGNAAPRLYVPYESRLDFDKITLPLLICDSELDCLMLSEDGQCCVCVPGLWSLGFCERPLGDLIRDFLRIPLKCRPIIILPDYSWSRDGHGSLATLGWSNPVHHLWKWRLEFECDTYGHPSLSNDKANELLFALNLRRDCQRKWF